MPQGERNRVFDPDSVDSRWRSFFKVGGMAAWVALLIFRRWLGEEILLLRTLAIIRFGPRTIPTSKIDWFTLFQNHPLVGLALLNAFDTIKYARVGLIFLGLYYCPQRRQ